MPSGLPCIHAHKDIDLESVGYVKRTSICEGVWQEVRLPGVSWRNGKGTGYSYDQNTLYTSMKFSRNGKIVESSRSLILSKYNPYNEEYI